MIEQPDSGYRDKVARALAEKFTSPYGARNPDWDIDGPDDDTNPYHLTVPMEERIAKGSMMGTFTAGDGHLSMAPASIPETVDIVLAVRDAEMERLRERLRQAEMEGITHRLALDEVAKHATQLRADLAEARAERDRYRFAWQSAVRGRRRACMERDTFAEAMPCAWCDNTGIAPEDRFGRDQDGAPMVDGDQSCPEGCPVRRDIAYLLSEEREAEQLRVNLDKALWLHAEAAWQRDEAVADVVDLDNQLHAVETDRDDTPPLDEDPVAVALGLAEPANDAIAQRAKEITERVDALKKHAEVSGWRATVEAGTPAPLADLPEPEWRAFHDAVTSARASDEPDLRCAMTDDDGNRCVKGRAMPHHHEFDYGYRDGDGTEVGGE